MLSIPILSSAVNFLLAEQRIFVNLDSTLQSYYLLATAETFTGDLSIKYVTTTTGTEMDFADGFGITSAGIFKAPASVTDIELNGVSVGLGATAPLIGKEEFVKFIGATSVTITGYGQSGSNTNYFNGILSDPKIPSTTLKLDEATANVEYSEENTFGVDTWIPFTNIGAQWVDDGGGAYTRTPGGSLDNVDYTTTDYSAGDAVSVTITQTNMAGSGFNVRVQGGGSVTLPMTNGTHTVVCIAGTIGSTRVRCVSASSSGGTISNVIIQEIQGNAVTYINIPEANRELFELNVNGTQWDNISPPVQVLPAIIEIA